ncbi:MAG: GerMN domain-containing protein [bacterium]|jgi:germination protein M
MRGLKWASWLLLAFLASSLWALPGCASGIPIEEEANAFKEETPGKQELVTVYYETQTEDYLLPVNAWVTANGDLPRHAIDKLLAGPTDGELLKSPLPVKAVVRDLYVKNGIACLDLGGEIVEKSEELAWQRILDSIVLTLTEFPEIDAVQILLDGQVVDNAEAAQLKEPLTRPDSINRLVAEDASGVETTLYFSYHDAYLVPVTVSLDPETEDVIAATVAQLVAGPQGMPGLSPVFPEGTKLLSCEHRGEILRLNFSSEAVLRDTKGNIRSEQSITLGALGYTLSQFEGIESLELLVNGEPLVVPRMKQSIPIPQTYRDWTEPATSRGNRLLSIIG